MHLESRDAHKEARSAKVFLRMMFAQYVADVLAQEALDALAELLPAVHVDLRHLPFHSRLRLEWRNLPIHLVIPGDVGYQILDRRKRLQRQHCNRLVFWKIVNTCFARQTRPAIYLGRA